MRWLVFCLLLLACNTEEPSAPDVDGYLQYISKEIPGSTSQDYLDIGNKICEDLRSGKTSDEIVKSKIDNGVSPENSIILFQISVQYLCPDIER